VSDVDWLVADGRAAAEALMLTPCRVRRPAGTETDKLSGRTTPKFTAEDVYSAAAPAGATPVPGGCKVQDAGTQARDVEVGSGTVTLAAVEVHIPATASPARAGDVIELLDGETVVRTFRVDRAHTKTLQTAQRLPVTELEGGL
jgi:hypothetical protein